MNIHGAMVQNSTARKRDHLQKVIRKESLILRLTYCENHVEYREGIVYNNERITKLMEVKATIFKT